MAHFTVEIKIGSSLVVARTATRISGQAGSPCLYVTDDGRVIEHHYNEGAAILAIKMLSFVHNTLRAVNIKQAEKWERRRRRLSRPQAMPLQPKRTIKVRRRTTR